jgi:hypothetical protein
MTEPGIDPQQRELLLDWAREQNDPFTHQDVSTFFQVHYLTGYRWVKQLVREGFFERYPIRRGRADQFIVVKEAMEPAAPGVHSEASLRAIRVACGNDQLSIAAWAMRNLNNTSIAAVAHGLLYLYTRSYYHGAPEHEHLRGPAPVVEVRTFVANQLNMLKRDIAVIEQVLQFKQPWIEDDELAQRFGEFPPGTTMTQVLEKAHLFADAILGYGARVEAETVQAELAIADTPEVPPTIAPATVGDAMSQLKGVPTET